jgi:hypothetical protein
VRDTATMVNGFDELCPPHPLNPALRTPALSYAAQAGRRPR